MTNSRRYLGLTAVIIIGIGLFWSQTVARFFWQERWQPSAEMSNWPGETPQLIEKRAEYIHQVSDPMQRQTRSTRQSYRGTADMLSADRIAQVLSSYRNYFDRCYGKFIREAKSRKGRVDLTFSILNSGRVENVKVISSSLKDTILHRCLTTVVERVRFSDDESRKPLQVQYPIYFE